MNTHGINIDIKAWGQAVDVLYNQLITPARGKKATSVDPLTALTAISGWLNTSLTEYTDGSSEAMHRRVGWVFSNGYSVTIGYGINPTIANVNNEIQEDTPLPFQESVAKENWNYKRSANGWERNSLFTPEELIDFIANISTEIDAIPTLILPLESSMDVLEDDWWQDADDEELTIKYKPFTKLLEILSNQQALQELSNILGWDIEVCDSDDYIPVYSDYNRFWRFVSFLEETGKWHVNIDECCAACSRGTWEYAVKDNPELKDAPEFLTWGQNTQDSHLPDGSIWVNVFINEEEDERFIKENARKFGFDLGEWESDNFEGTGELIFGDND